MTTLTKVLAHTCGSPVVGLCHALFENIEFLAQIYPDEMQGGISMRYAGINHFFFTTAIQGPQMDILADLKNRVQDRSLADLGVPPIIDPAGWSSGRELATVLMRATGTMPYIGDRHTSEFFGDYITDLEAMGRLKIIRTSIADRKAHVAKHSAKLNEFTRSGIPDDFLKKSREAAADIIAASAIDRPFSDVGNLPNIGQITNLPLGLVVETEVRVDRLGFTPLCFGPLPPAVLRLVQPYAEVFLRSVEAALTGSREGALEALRLDPVCSRLDAPRVRELGLRLLEAHRDYTGYLR